MKPHSRNLRAAMIRKYGSQGNFAQEMGLDEGFLSRVINGRRVISAMTQIEWAEKLDQPLEELFV